MGPSPPLSAEIIEPWRLRAALRETGVTQAALARELEIDVSTIGKWLRGERPIYRLAWYAILFSLGLPRGWRPASDLAAEPDPE